MTPAGRFPYRRHEHADGWPDFTQGGGSRTRDLTSNLTNDRSHNDTRG